MPIALFRRYPSSEARIPWVRIGEDTTPLETVEVRGPAGPRTVLVKRDDRSAPLYGGNKVRKLEFLLAEAERRGAHRLITAGAAASHHALATTIYGRKRGFEVTTILFPQPPTRHVHDMLRMIAGFGADIWWVRRMELVPLGTFRARLRYRTERPLVIAPGGSDAIGTLGYVNAGLELAEQLEAGVAPTPSVIHIAGGTLGTAAGLALGLGLAGLAIPIVASRITGRIVANERALRTLVEGAAAILARAGVPVPAPDVVLSAVTLDHGWIGRGYGFETAEGRAATEAFADVGLHLDPTYTAKAAAALLASPAAAAPPLFVLTLSGSEPLDRARTLDAGTLPAPVAAYLAQIEAASPD